MSEMEAFAEVEAKLVLPRRRAIAGVESAVKATGMKLLSSDTVEIVDTYIDTDDWFFFRAGLACRIRKKGEGAKLTFKTLQPIRDGVATRSEWEESVALPEGKLRRLPDGELATWMAPALGARRLRRLVRVRQTRVKMVFRRGRSLDVEVSADDVRYEGRRKRGLREAMVELELMRGKPERIADLSRVLQAAHGWLPDDTSKFERALGAAGLAPPVAPKVKRPQRKDTVGAGFVRLVRGHLYVLRWNEPGTRVGIDAEYLHDMRVASRRLLAALLVFEDVVRVRDRRGLRRSVKRVAAALGGVRDLDVYLGNLDGYAERIPGDAEQVLAPLRAHLQSQRKVARAEMLRYLDSGAHAAFLARFEQVAAGDGTLRARPSRRRMVRAAPALLRLRLDEVLGGGRAIHPGAPADAYHELRKGCKKLRYAAEFFRDLMPEAMTTLRDHQVTLQDLLGAHQDADVSMLALDAFVAETKLTKRQRQGFAALRDAQARAAQDCRDRFPGIWAAFDERAFLATLERQSV